MTGREFYQAIVDGNVTEEIVAYAQNAIAKLDERNSARKAKTAEKKSTVDEPIKAQILASMEDGVTYTSTVVASEFGIEIDGKPISTSKANVLLSALVADGAVVETEKVKVKGGRKVKGYVKA